MKEEAPASHEGSPTPTGDVAGHRCDFILKGEMLRCLTCGTEKPQPPRWSIADAPEHDWGDPDVYQRAKGPLYVYQCRRCGLGATQGHRSQVQPHPTRRCRPRRK